MTNEEAILYELYRQAQETECDDCGHVGCDLVLHRYLHRYGASFICEDCGCECDCVDVEAPNEASEIEYDDGEWHAATLGHLVGIFIDCGSDPAVLFRVVEDGPFLDSGAYARKWEVVAIPNGLVLEVMRQYGVDHAHKLLKAYLENGLVT